MTGLTADQAATVERAREILGQPHEYDLAGMASRTGKLEWALREMIALAEKYVRGS
jgi:hypothetical protein